MYGFLKHNISFFQDDLSRYSLYLFFLFEKKQEKKDAAAIGAMLQFLSSKKREK